MANKQKNKIFISWSGNNSKEIAKGIKDTLENKVFSNTGLSCFVSDVDIASGDDWWNRIKRELKACKHGIVCITKENAKAPWIYYEAGAMIAQGIKVIPLLINCSSDLLGGTPFKQTQYVDFYNRVKFVKMITDINENMNLLQLNKKQLEILAIAAYEDLHQGQNLSPILKNLKSMRIFHEKYIYPQNISTVNIGTLFISAPMSSIPSNEYTELRDFVLTLRSILQKIGIVEITCPLFDKESPALFDGKTKAINDNFSNLKQVENMIVIYPHSLPTSALVEIGYGIALCKKMIIFYKDELPYILEKAGENIEHVRTFKYNSYEEISNTIRLDGKTIFEIDRGD